jgi:hypothetical protein
VNAVWVVARNYRVALLGYPVFDVSVLENVEIFWNFDIFDQIRANERVVGAAAKFE